MKRRITRKTIVVAVVGALLFLAASTAQAGWLFVLSASVIGMVIGSMFVRQGIDRIEITRKAPARARVGDEVAVTLEVEATGSRPTSLARIEDDHPAFATLAVLCGKLPPGGKAAFESVRTALARGEYSGGKVVVTAGSPFGLIKSKMTSDVNSPIVVVPRWVDLRSFPILEPSSFPMESLHERARTGGSDDYMGVREYRPGDPRRTVHWRSTARIGRLVVREYEEQATSRLALVLVGPDAGTVPDSAFEMLVSAAASIGRYAIATGHPVDMVRAGGDGIERTGDVDRSEILEWLARAQPNEGDLVELTRAALVRVGSRGTVVLLAPSSRAADINAAIRTVQGAGSRAIVVTALTSSWDPRSDDSDMTALSDVSARAPVRVLRKGERLETCLAG